jgi:hypothetical protein
MYFIIPKVVPMREQVAFLEEKYEDLKVPAHKLKKWFSSDRRVFFDC